MQVDKAAEYMADLKLRLTDLENGERELARTGSNFWPHEFERLKAKASTILLGYKASAATGKSANDLELIQAETGFYDEYSDLAKAIRGKAAEVNNGPERSGDKIQASMEDAYDRATASQASRREGR